MNKPTHKSGKRKTAIARATLKDGKGVVRINNMLLQNYEPAIYRLKIMEPLLLAEEVAGKVDLHVTVVGGGMKSRADAVRLAIAKALSDYSPKLRDSFLEYDRQLLVADVRFKETHKPNKHGTARGKKQKSYR